MVDLTHRDRLLVEKRDLDVKIRKLMDFICSEKFKRLPLETRNNLKDQYEVMVRYAGILNRRIMSEGNDNHVMNTGN